MPEHDAPTHKHTRDTNPDSISLRQPDDDDAMMDLRLPIASTGEVRNEGDEPLTRSELRGMAEQINTNRIGVFPEHGQSDLVDFKGYSQFEKFGYWTDAEIEGEASSDGEDMLFATARILDPEPLPSQTGRFREALSILREQAAAGVPVTTSIGWREDEDAPGGNDLLEVSISGLQADPRTGTEGGEQLVARAAVEAGADPEELVEMVRDAVTENDDMSDDTDPSDDEPEGGTTEEQRETEPDEEPEAEETREDEEDEEEEEEEEEMQECPECETDVQADANYCRECGEELTEREDDEDEEEDEDEDEEEEQSDDGDETKTQSDDTSDLEQRLTALEEELQAVRSGEVDVDTPDTPDDEDDETEREADDGDAEENRELSDPAEKPAWAR